MRKEALLGVITLAGVVVGVGVFCARSGAD